MKTGVKGKELWEVQKFIPAFCPNPKCGYRFEKQGEDFIEGRVVVGENGISESGKGYGIIVCQHCGNFTILIRLESRIVETLAEAQELVTRDGFANLQSIIAFGDQVGPIVKIFNKEIAGEEILGVERRGQRKD